MENHLRQIGSLSAMDVATMRQAKQFGFSDRQLSVMLNSDDGEVREWRKSRGIVAVY